MRVCIDTNVWISGLLFSGAPAKVVDLALTGRFQVVLSNAILDEVERNVVKKFSVAPKLARRLRNRLAAIADVYETSGVLSVIKEKHADNLVLETAVLGQAQYLVTGDRKHLLPLEVFRTIKIVDSSTFLAVMGHET